MLLKISIITVSYNQEKFIEENIRSIIDQNYQNVEHIIIDANSTDGTIDILHKYNKNIDWISETDNGQSEGLNKGFEKASGEIIGWINSDDRLAPGALHKVAQFFSRNPDEIAVVGDQALINEEGEIIHIIKSRAYNYDYLLNFAKSITQNSIFFRRDVFDMIGYLDESLNYTMDLDFFIRMTGIKKIPYLPDTLAEFRIHPNSKTAKGSYHFALESLKIRKKYDGKILSKAWQNDIYIIITQPLRRINWLRNLVQKIKRK